MKKRLFFLITTLCLCIFVFIGCSSKNTEEQQLVNNFTGIWGEEELNWIYGGSVLEIEPNGNKVDIKYQYTQSAPDSRVAQVSKSVKLSEFVGNTISFEFDDDGWGNYGTITLTFMDLDESSYDYIQCSISNTGSNEYPVWGIPEYECYMFYNENAYEWLEYTMEEYELYMAQSEPDLSHASGILSYFGVTEQEFRDNCQRLFTTGIQIGTPDGTETYYTDIVDYPTNYLDNWFVIDNLAGFDFTCSYKGISDDGYPYYEDINGNYNAVIYDFRDDPLSPNISMNDKFTPYVIFRELRTINGNDWLVFWMISVDK